MSKLQRPSIGLVLSGGGARGAYEAGVVLGISEALAPGEVPFDVLAGTSIGALNAVFLAAHAERPDMGAAALADSWRALELSRHLRLDMRGVLGWKRALGARDWEAPRLLGRALLDFRAFDRIVRHEVPWERLHRNIEHARVRALVVPALHIATGHTMLFAELTPGTEFVRSLDQPRTLCTGRVGPEHVLASCAIPMLFPARLIDGEGYCDGGVRFNTPIASALRAGAERLVIVSLLSDEGGPSADAPAQHRIHAYNSPVFIFGKLLTALLLDPFHHDLRVLERFNLLMEALEANVAAPDLAKVQRAVVAARGLPYRKVRTLVFTPSRDLGQLARQHAGRISGSRFSSWLLARAAMLGTLLESDLESFILLDAAFTSELVELGRSDAAARRDEIRAFFESPSKRESHEAPATAST
jgi:NTE family protein